MISPERSTSHAQEKQKKSGNPAMKSILDHSSKGQFWQRQFQEKTKELMVEKNLPEGFSLVYKEQPIAVQNQHPTTFTNLDS